MADQETEEKQDAEEQSKPSGGGKIGILTWVIMAVVILALSGSGFLLGRLVAGSTGSDPALDPAAQADGEGQNADASEGEADGEPPSSDTWYYDKLDSVVVNPDEPGATRFVRVGLILELSATVTDEQAEELVTKKKPLLINWLNLYFKGLSLDQMEDEKDMNRILAEITDAFNEILFPNSTPLLKRSLIREFNIQ